MATCDAGTQAFSPLLRFMDTFETLSTEDFSFEKAAPTQSDISGLEFYREIDSLRRVTCYKQSMIKEFPTVELLDKYDQYTRYIRLLSEKLQLVSNDSNPPDSTGMGHWGKPTHMWKLPELLQEAAMATFQMGGAMRFAAFLLTEGAARNSNSDTMLSSPLPSFASMRSESLPASNSAGNESSAQGLSTNATVAGPLADATTLLRRAAGVYQWLSEYFLVRLVDSLPADRPTELMPAMADCMRLMCLAEAQVVTAYRAGQRSTRSSTTSALYLGACDLFEQAAKVIRDKAGSLRVVSDRLRRFLAISASLQRARSLMWWGDELRTQGQAGQGESCCVEAAVTLGQCMTVAEGDILWSKLLASEQSCLEEFRLRCEKDRTGVYFQTISKPAENLPKGGGKILVVAIAYAPLPMARSSSMR